MVDDAPVLTRTLTPRQRVALDVLVATLYTLLLLTLAVGPQQDGPQAVPTWLSMALVLLMGLPLAVRRLWPVPVFAVVLGASLAALALGVVRDGFIGAGLVLYMVAAGERPMGRTSTLLIAATCLVGAVLLVVAGTPAPTDAGTVLMGIVVLAASWTIGRATRERRRLAERSAEQRVHQAVADERLRIARDLHDVVAHGLSLIVIKAATANHLVDSRPDEARDALQVIEATGRDAMAEMRQMLTVLRADDAEAAGLAPTPGIDRLPALVGQVAAAGVQVDLRVEGADRVPPAVGLTVYRVVQEALTNVVRHAAPATCRVEILADEDEVRIEVEDDGARRGVPATALTSGQGLVGLRERVRLLEGESSAGPLPERGFRVTARLPLLPDPAHDGAAR